MEMLDCLSSYLEKCNSFKVIFTVNVVWNPSQSEDIWVFSNN